MFFANTGPSSGAVIKEAMLNTYQSYPDGMTTIPAEWINANRLAFIHA